jgi:hypothetical protein
MLRAKYLQKSGLMQLERLGVWGREHGCSTGTRFDRIDFLGLVLMATNWKIPKHLMESSEWGFPSYLSLCRRAVMGKIVAG